MELSAAARRKLGNLAEFADRIVAHLIIERGGNAANVRMAGEWAQRLLGEAAIAATQGDRAAIRAIKIAKQARRLGEKH